MATRFVTLKKRAFPASRFLLPAIALFAQFTSMAADRFWVGSDGNWNQTANWSTESGGAPGASVPATGDKAIFDEHSGNAAINCNVNCGGLSLSGFSGTITIPHNYTVQIQNTFSQDSGAINCDTNLVTFYKCNCNFAGGAFTVAEGGNTRFQNAGSTSGYTISGNVTLENVNFYTSGGGGTYPWSIAVDATVIINKNVLFNNYGMGRNSLNTGAITVYGSVTNLNGDMSATGKIIFAGSNDQTLYGVSGTDCLLPNIEINKTGGTLLLEGTLQTARSWTHIAGDVCPGTSLVTFRPHANYNSGISSASGRATFYDLTFSQTSGGGSSYYYYLKDDITLVVSNQLSFGVPNQHGGQACGGVLEALGDVFLHSDYRLSTTILKITGVGDQTMKGTQDSVLAFPPGVLIEKPSGDLTLDGIFSLQNTWTHVSGNVNPGDSYVYFYAKNPVEVKISGADGYVRFNNVRLTQEQGGGINYYIDLLDNTVLVVNNLTMNAGLQMRYSTIDIHGNFQQTAATASGTSLLRFTGSNDQTISTTPDTLGFNMEVDKEAGTLSLASKLTFATASRTFTVKAGTFNLAGQNLRFTANGCNFQMLNSPTLMTELSETACGNITITGNGSATIAGNLFVSVPQGFEGEPSTVYEIITAATKAVQNTPFIAELASPNYIYNAFYNTGGNRVYVTNVRFVAPGALFRFR